jgi:hypothetical protein
VEVAAPVRGMVVDCLGEPIAGASVELCRGSLRLATTTSSAQGEFALPCVDVGGAEDLALVAGALGKASIRVEWSERRAWWRLQLPDGARLAGRVVDERQRAVAGALVCMAHDRRLGQEVSAVTDADGRFQFDGAPIGRVRLLAWRNGSQIERLLVDLRADRECEIALRHAAGPSLRVRVHGLDAASMSRASVSFVVTEWTPHYPACRFGGPLDERGGIELSGLPEGAGTDDPELQVDGLVVRCRWRPDDDPGLVDLYVEPLLPRDVELVCVDTAGHPLSAIPMEVRAGLAGPAIRTVTAASGRASVSLPMVGSEAVYVSLVGGGWVFTGPRPPRRVLDVIGRTGCRVDLGSVGPVHLTLQPAALVRGRCVAGDGRPHQHGEVILSAQWTSPQGTSQSTAVGEAQLDVSGRFESAAFSAEADVVMRVSLRAMRVVESSPFQVSSGSTVELPPMVVPAFSEIRGVLRDDRGVPMPGRVLMAEAVGAQRWRYATTDRRGRFRFDLVPAGVWRLVLSSVDCAEEARGEAFSIAEGALVEQDLAFGGEAPAIG